MPDLTRAEWTIAATTLTLSAAVHLLPQLLRLPANLAVGGMASSMAALDGAGIEAQGLRTRDVPRGLGYGLAASAVIAAAMSAGVRAGPSRRFYRTDGIVKATAPKAAYEVLVRIPLGTAFSEEIVFRGALLGMLMRHQSRTRATVLTSLLFGVWHVVPTLHRLETSPATDGRSVLFRALWVLGTVVTTSIAGGVLAWLRLRSGSIVAPWLAHFAANGTGFAAAWLASRVRFAARQETRGPDSSCSTEARATRRLPPIRNHYFLAG